MFIKRFLLLIPALVIFNGLRAQLCQGSLGDPVVNITFGSGESFGTPLDATLSNYTFVYTVCPNDNFYTIANYTSTCFGDSWLTVNEDHTPGDINGYMMIVNASIEPGDFYVQQVDGLCGGTTYEFASWMMNVIRPTACSGNTIKPNITFYIETISGNVLQSFSTGDIGDNSEPIWKQYGLFFTTPANTSSVVIRMKNNANGGCGNDIILDDITFRPCGPKVTVSVNGAGANLDVCKGDNRGYTFTSTILSGYANTSYQWQKSTDSLTWTDITNANNATYSTPAIAAAGKYFYRLAVAAGSNISLSSCRVASDFVTISVHDLPIPLASNNGPVCESTSLTLTANNGSAYLWAGPANFTNTTQSAVIPKLAPANVGKYYVKVTSQYGCINTDSTMVGINLSPSVNAGSDVDICEGSSSTLQGSGGNGVSYTWSPVAGLSNPSTPTPVASPLETTLYILTVDDGVCKNSDSVLVTVAKKPFADAGADKAIIKGEYAVLDGVAGGTNISYFWAPDLYMSSDMVLNPQVSPPFDTAYTLHVVSNSGCGEATDKVLVKYYKDVYIPNAFTPNNDQRNDTWNLPVLPAFPLAEVSVYNRYGQLVFFNKGYTKQWDGTFNGAPQPSGVYLYVVDLKNGFKKLSGTVVLLR